MVTNPPKLHAKHAQQGFSLVQLALILSIAGIIFAAVLPGSTMGNNAEKDHLTKKRMEKIEEAMRGFMAVNMRRPCPADGTQDALGQYGGYEAPENGRCIGAYSANFTIDAGTVSASGSLTLNSPVVTGITDTTGILPGMYATDTTLQTAGSHIPTNTHVLTVDSKTQVTLDRAATATASVTVKYYGTIGGVVPTKTLGLPDEYMFDGYNRRINYVVDLGATAASSCRNMMHQGVRGSVIIKNGTLPQDASSDVLDNVMWALISYGTDGQGAFPPGANGGSRFNTGNADADKKVNQFFDVTDMSTSTYSSTLIRKEKTATFADTVWTNEGTKNTCCVGNMCNATTVVQGTGSELVGSNVAIGDINGDGIPDMIYYQVGKPIHVVFGKKTGLPSTGGLPLGTLNSGAFFSITNTASASNFPNFAGSVAVGDLNGDGYDDIVIGYGNGSASYVSVYYGGPAPVDIDINASTGTHTINTLTFPAATGNAAPQLAVGRFHDGLGKDILALVQTGTAPSTPNASSTAYVIYGATSGSYNTSPDTTAWLRAATTGYKITTTTSMDAIYGVGDLNNDTYDDMPISSYTNNQLFVLFGQTIANRSLDTAGTASTPDIISIDTQVAAAGKGAKFTSATGNTIGRYSMAVGNFNPQTDVIGDLIFNYGNNFNVYYGSGSWANSINVTTATNFDGTTSNKGFVFNVTNYKPSWITASPITKVIVGDVNGDAKTDIVFTDSTASTIGTSLVALQPTSGWVTLGPAGTINLFNGIFDNTGGSPNAATGFRIDGAAGSDAATVKAIADVNADGRADLIVGEPGTGTGKSHIIFGPNNVPQPLLMNLSNYP